MATDLTPAEKEDREFDKLTTKFRPPPSRKYREKRAPRPWQRNRQVDVGQKKDTTLLALKISKIFNDDELRKFERILEDELEDESEPNFDDLIQKLRDPSTDLEKKQQKREKKNKFRAPSNEHLSMMNSKVSTYHGVLDNKGHPTNPINTGYRSYDKRYFTNDDYDIIVKYAGKLLGEDWLKYGWEGGAEDAPLRSALDLAIHLANDNLYQSKIDSETYQLLLNRLAKWEYDTFSETVLPMKSPKSDKRSASTMTRNRSAYSNIVRIASELRQTDPMASLNILKNLRGLVATEAVSEEIASNVAPDINAVRGKVAQAPAVPPPPSSPVVAQGDIEPGSQLEVRSLSDSDLGKLRNDSEVKKLMEAHGITGADVDSFIHALDGAFEKIHKTGSSETILLKDLVRLAASNPQAKLVLGPMILAAKRKKKKVPSKSPVNPSVSGKKKVPEKIDSKKKASPKKEKRATLTAEDQW